MKPLIFLLVLSFVLAGPVQAMEFEAPIAPENVRTQVETPADSFGQGLWNVIKAALCALDSSLVDAARSCLAVCAAVMVCGLLRQLSGKSSSAAIDLACSVAVAAALLQPSTALIHQGEQIIRQLNDYGKLLLPVMTSALAAQGGVTASAALYTATALFNAMLSAAITRLMIPILYIFITLSIAYAAVGEELIGKFRSFLRWLTTWILKISLYLFTGFLAVTGVVSGNADAAALKAAKITISGAVPVVGSILSDATEAVLVSAGVLRSAAGVYGILTIIALCLSPFLKIGIQYLLLKTVSALCTAFDKGRSSGLLGDFSTVMGMMLAMIGTQSVLILISTVCFMKGVG